MDLRESKGIGESGKIARFYSVSDHSKDLMFAVL